ncbi:protein of unknown function [Paraburkholderia kururiensis]
MGRRRVAGRPALGPDAARYERQDAAKLYDYPATGRLMALRPCGTATSGNDSGYSRSLCCYKVLRIDFSGSDTA